MNTNFKIKQMENNKTILLHMITPNELKDLIIADLKIELKSILNEPNETENYSVKEVSKILKLSELTIYNYISKGKLKAFKVGRKYQIKKKDLDESMKEVKSLKYRR